MPVGDASISRDHPGLVRVLQGWRYRVIVLVGRNERTEKIKSPGATEEERLLAGWNKSRRWKSRNPINSVSSPVLIQLIDDVASSKKNLGAKYWGAAVEETSFWKTII